MGTQLLNQVAALQIANKRLQRQAQKLADERKRERAHALIDRAHVDAMQILTFWISGGAVQRDWLDMSNRRWSYAVALLRLAKLAQGRYLALRLADHDQALTALAKARDKAYRSPEILLSRLPNGRRPRVLMPD